MNWSIILLFVSTLQSVLSFSTSESEKLKNRIVFHETNLSYDVARDILESDRQHYDILSIRHNDHNISSYLCNLPRQEELNITIPETKATLHDLKLQAIKLITDTFSQDKCLYAYGIHANYWTIGYCYGDKVIQFHEDLEDFLSGKHRPYFPEHVYVLGRFSGTIYQPKFQFDAREFSVTEGYSHELEGELCDLTGQPRKLSITYVCDSGNTGLEILDIREIKTCEYEMTINIPNLCQLNVAKEFTVDIVCSQIFSQ
ncbi:YOS9 Protein OS-9 [Candida maltosa Xu316]